MASLRTDQAGRPRRLNLWLPSRGPGGGVRVLTVLLTLVQAAVLRSSGVTRPGSGMPARASTRRRSAAQRTSAVSVLAVLAVLTAGCQTVVGTTETVRSIQQEVGALDVQVVTPDPSGERVVVRYSSQHSDEQAVRAEAERVAEVTWRELPLQFDRAVLEPRGAPAGVQTVSYSREELQQQFGPRDPALDQGLLEAVARFDVAALVVIILVIVLVVVLLRRSRADGSRQTSG